MASLTLWADELADTLRRLNIDALLGCYTGVDDRKNSFYLHNFFIDDVTRAFIELMFLNKRVPSSRLDGLFSVEVRREMAENGVLAIAGDTAALKDLRLVMHESAFILCHAKQISGFAYHGADSLALARIIRHCQGAVLDVCTGVGTQGIALARNGALVTGIDINESCADLFRFNARLNGVTDRVSFKCCDVDQIEGSFDWIICNPPLLPVPGDVKFPLVGDGGPDAQAVLARVLLAARRLLRDGGKVRFVGTVLGDAERPDLAALADVAREAGLLVDLILPCREPLAPGELMFEGLVATAILAGAPAAQARAAFGGHFVAAGKSHLYSLLGTARRVGEATEAPGIQSISRHYEINRSFWSL